VATFFRTGNFFFIFASAPMFSLHLAVAAKKQSAPTTLQCW
jgi:hypothetical protein